MVTDGQTPLKIALADVFSKTVIDALIAFGDKSVEELFAHIEAVLAQDAAVKRRGPVLL